MLLRFVSACALFAIVQAAAGARAQPAEPPADAVAPTAGERPVVALVHVPGLSATSFEAFTSALRAHLGADTVIRVLESTPPEAEDAVEAWAGPVADAEGAMGVLWVVPDSEGEGAVLWIYNPRASELTSFRSNEPLEFDRYRSLAMAARSLLREAHVPDEPPEADPTAETETEEPAPVDTTPEPQPPPAAAPAPTPPPPEPDDGVLSFHGVMGPALRLGAPDPVLGFDASVGLRVHRHAAVRVTLDLNREEGAAGGAPSRWTRSRLSAGVLGLATVPFGAFYLHGGAGVGLVRASLASQEDGNAGTVFGGVVTVLAALGWRIADQVFVEVPLSLDILFARQPPLFGVEVGPTFEVSLGLALGLGRW